MTHKNSRFLNLNFARLAFTIAVAIMMVSAFFFSGLTQPWQQNDLIFNPSGIPSLPFSQPRFFDVDADDNFDLILGNLSENPYYFQNNGSASNPVFQAGPDIFSMVSALDAEMGVFADLDNDGDADFICGGYTGLNYYENTGDSAQVACS